MCRFTGKGFERKLVINGILQYSECKNQNISFVNTSGNVGGGWNYNWDFNLAGTVNVLPQNLNSQNPNNEAVC